MLFRAGDDAAQHGLVAFGMALAQEDGQVGRQAREAGIAAQGAGAQRARGQVQHQGGRVFHGQAQAQRQGHGIALRVPVDLGGAFGVARVLGAVDDPSGKILITNNTPDPLVYKTFDFEVSGGLRIDDYVYSRYGTSATGAYPPATFGAPNDSKAFVNGTGFTRITGIVAYSFGNKKLYPRAADDLVFAP